jgi:hypothetical protein
MDSKEALQFVFGLLFICVILGVLVSWLISINAALKLHESSKVGKANQENCGEYYLEGESARSLIYDTYTNNIKSSQENTLAYMLVLVVIIVGVMLCIFIYLSYAYNEKRDKSGKTLSLLIGLTAAYLGVFIFSVISRSGLNNQISFMIGGSNEESKLLGSQIGYLLGITVLTGLSFFVYNNFFPGGENVAISPNHFMYILGCMIILTIFIPVVTSDIFKFKTKIEDYYYTKVVGEDDKSLNKKVETAYASNSLLENHLRINIQRLKNLEELPVIDEEYKKELYKYVMHGMNMAELRNIIIPEQLLNNINSKYLKGENIIVLKNDLLGYYNGGSIDNLKKYFKDDNNKYIGGLTDSKLLSLLNTHVRNNDTYKINNNIPSDIRNLMQELRQNTQMEDTVAEYYKKIVTITIALFIFGFYLIFHRIYEQTDMFRQSVALIMMVLMVFVGFLGWFFKELWL